MSNTKRATDRINYSNRKKVNSDFNHKDLKRSNCFSSNFSNSNFDHANFKGAQFKHCNFTECTFDSAEFVATNLRNSKFIDAKLKNVVFEAANLDGVNFENATFENVIFVETDMTKAINLDVSAEGIRVFDMPIELDISQRLERAIRASKKNEFIKKAGVLDTKEGKINSTSVMILLELFSEETLVTSFAKLKADVNENFGTLSYIINEIKKYEA